MSLYKEVALDFGFKSTSEKKKDVGKPKSGKYSFHKISSFIINFFNFPISIYLPIQSDFCRHLLIHIQLKLYPTFLDLPTYPEILYRRSL